MDEAEVAEQRPEKRASILPLLVVGLIGLGGGSALGGKALGATVGEQLARRQMAPGGRSGGGGHGGEEIPPLHVIDNLVVNPARSAGTRFLLTSVAIEISPDDAVLLQARDAELRHALIMVLGTKTVEELTDISLRPGIAEEIFQTLDRILGSEIVHRVFLPQFVIQ